MIFIAQTYTPLFTMAAYLSSGIIGEVISASSEASIAFVHLYETSALLPPSLLIQRYETLQMLKPSHLLYSRAKTFAREPAQGACHEVAKYFTRRVASLYSWAENLSAHEYKSPVKYAASHHLSCQT